MKQSSRERLFCFLCDKHVGRVLQVNRHFERKHEGIDPKEGKPASGGNWIRESARKVKDLSKFFSQDRIPPPTRIIASFGPELMHAPSLKNETHPQPRKKQILDVLSFKKSKKHDRQGNRRTCKSGLRLRSSKV